MPERKMNILFLLPSLTIGGAERQVLDLTNGLSEKRFRAHLATFEKDLALIRQLDRTKTTFHRVERRWKFDLRPVRGIARLVDEETIDLLHCTNQLAYLYGLLSRSLSRRKCPVVLALHTTKNRNLKNEFFDWALYAPLMLFSGTIIAVCQSQKDYWSRKFPFLSRKFVAIHNGIDPEKYQDTMSPHEKQVLRAKLGLGQADFLVGMLAELRPEKRHDRVFGALRKLRDDGMRIKLLLIGGGERERSLRRLADDLRISPDIVWLGDQKDPRPFLGLCDVLVSASSAETFSMAILEGLSMGKPVVGTDVGGTAELIQDGRNGILLRSNHPASLAAALRRIFEDGELRREFSRNARDSVLARYTRDRMISKTESLFLSLREEGLA